MKKTLIVYMSLALSGVLFPAMAQSGDEELQKAIVVETDYQPELLKSTRLGTNPATLEEKQTKISLDYSDWAIPAKVDPLVVTQTVDDFAEKFKYSDKRGYATFGMGNYLNIVGNAGYRIVNTDKTDFGVWLQHNSTSGFIDGLHNSINEKYYKYSRQYVIEDRVGLDFSNVFSKGVLKAETSYHFDRFNYYGSGTSLPGNTRQVVNEFNINALWRGESVNDNQVSYYIGAEYNYFGNKFGFRNFCYDTGFFDEGLTENILNINGGAEFLLGGSDFAGADLAFQYLGYRNLQGNVSGGIYETTENIGGKSFGMLSVTPYYSHRTDNMNLRIGAHVDLSFDNGTFFRIAPDVRFDWEMSRMFSLYASATGGNEIHTFHNVAARNRYVNPSLMLPTSYTMVDAEAGLNFGLFKGFTITPFVGFAVVRDALVTAFTSADNNMNYPEPTAATTYQAVDMNGAKMGLKTAYNYSDKVEFKAAYTFAPQGTKSGYQLADNRPEHVVDAKLKVTPIRQLDLYVDYRFMGGRRVLNTHYYPMMGSEQPATMMSETTIDLGTFSDLGFGAAYRFTDMFSAYCRLNNLLNRHQQLYYGMYAQHFNFLVGAAVNF
jgi:hypothetical protein